MVNEATALLDATGHQVTKIIIMMVMVMVMAMAVVMAMTMVMGMAVVMTNSFNAGIHSNQILLR